MAGPYGAPSGARRSSSAVHKDAAFPDCSKWSDGESQHVALSWAGPFSLLRRVRDLQKGKAWRPLREQRFHAQTLWAHTVGVTAWQKDL